MGLHTTINQAPHRPHHPCRPAACQVQSLAPLVLKTTHGWDESGVARLFQARPLSELS